MKRDGRWAGLSVARFMRLGISMDEFIPTLTGQDPNIGR